MRIYELQDDLRLMPGDRETISLGATKTFATAFAILTETDDQVRDKDPLFLLQPGNNKLYYSQCIRAFISYTATATKTGIRHAALL